MAELGILEVREERPSINKCVQLLINAYLDFYVYAGSTGNLWIRVKVYREKKSHFDGMEQFCFI